MTFIARARVAAAAVAGLVCLLSSPPPALAQFPTPLGPYEFYPADRTVNTPQPSIFNGRDGIIGFARVDTNGAFQDPSSPTVTFAQNGNYRFNLFTYNASKLVVDGGAVFDDVQRNRVVALDTSLTTLKAGRIREYRGFASSRFDMTGGELWFANAFENASLNINGGTVRTITTLDHPTVTLSGTNVGTLQIGGGTVGMLGGRVTTANFSNGEVVASGGAVVALVNVEVEGSVSAVDNSSNEGATVNVSGGTIGGATARAPAAGGSTVNLDATTVRFNVVTQGGGAITLANTEVQGSAIVGLTGRDGSTEGFFRLSAGSSIGGSVQVANRGLLQMTGGSVGAGIRVTEEALAILTGGTAAGEVSVSDQGQMTFDGLAAATVLRASELGTLNFVSGFVGQDLVAEDSGQVNMSGGLVARDAGAFGDARLFVTGGLVNGSLVATDRSVLVAGGGTVAGGALVLADARLALSGTRISEGVLSLGAGRVTFGGGEVVGSVHASESSAVEMTAGRVGGELAGTGVATVNLVGGTVGTNLVAANFATVNMFGGVVNGSAVDVGDATLNRYGGVILGSIIIVPGAPGPFDALLATAAPPPLTMTVSDAATLNIYGTDLAAELVDPNYLGTSSLYRLSGSLADGGLLAEYFAVQNGTGASYHLLPPPVPEPGTGLAAMVAAAALLTRPRRASDPNGS